MKCSSMIVARQLKRLRTMTGETTNLEHHSKDRSEVLLSLSLSMSVYLRSSVIKSSPVGAKVSFRGCCCRRLYLRHCHCRSRVSSLEIIPAKFA